MPEMKTGPAYKLARAYKGPYRIVQLYPNGAELLLINKPRSQLIRVALNRVHRCPEPVADSNPSPETDLAAADQHGPQTTGVSIPFDAYLFSDVTLQ